MKNGPLFLTGLFLSLLISWSAIVLGSHAQLSSLGAYFDETEGQTFPLRAAGLAARGQLVYADLGCAACHTQQVRRPDFGSDGARGWGERQSVARDYIFEARPQLGASRFGPDLANLAARLPKESPEQGLFNLLYHGSSRHPSYTFLFQRREIAGEPSPRALPLTGAAAVPIGQEVVPTERAETLVAYLLSLNQGYVFPESRPVVPEKKPEPAPGPPPATHEVTPIPAAPPDQAKKKDASK